MVSSITIHLPIPYLSRSATKSHSFSHPESGSLLSDGKACNHICTSVFNKQSVKIFKSTEVNIKALHIPTIKVHCNAQSQYLYSVYLPSCLPSIHKLNSAIYFLSIRYRVDFYHGAFFLQNNQPVAKQLKMIFFNIGLN